MFAYFVPQQLQPILDLADEIGRMLTALRKALSSARELVGERRSLSPNPDSLIVRRGDQAWSGQRLAGGAGLRRNGGERCLRDSAALAKVLGATEQLVGRHDDLRSQVEVEDAVIANFARGQVLAERNPEVALRTMAMVPAAAQLVFHSRL